MRFEKTGPLRSTQDIAPVHSGIEGPDDGFVLVAVLGVLLILAVIGATVMLASRNQIKARAALNSHAELSVLADGVARLTAARLTARSSSAEEARKLPVDGTQLLCREGAARVQTSVIDVAGLLDINATPVEMIEMLLAGVGVAPDDAKPIARAIKSFRDEEKPASASAAEAEAYQAAGRAFGPKNAPFDSIEELDQVLGLSPAVLDRLRPLITVQSRWPGLDLTVAPIDLLRTIAKGRKALTPDIDVVIPVTRDQFQVPPQLLTRTSGRSAARGRAQVFEVRAVARAQDGRAVMRVAVVELSSLSPVGFIVREWSSQQTYWSPELSGDIAAPACAQPL